MPENNRGRTGGQARRALVRAGAAGLVLGLLSACQTTGGFETRGLSARDAEIARQKAAKGFDIVSETPKRIVIRARGKEVAAEPAEGYCIDAKSTKVTKLSAFVLISACLDAEDGVLFKHGGKDGKGAPDPRPDLRAAKAAFPGILTITVSGAKALGTEAASMDAFEALLNSKDGSALLGRGNGDSHGEVIATRRSGGAIYALIGEADGASPIFAPHFWRGFIDINDRLVLITVSCFSDRPVADDMMLSFLAKQVARLRAANGMPAVKDEQKIAALADIDLSGAPIGRNGVRIVTHAPRRAPEPASRVALVAAVGTAPNKAPEAAKRPG